MPAEQGNAPKNDTDELLQQYEKNELTDEELKHAKEEEEAEKRRPPSKFFKLISNIFNFILLMALGAAIVLTMFTLDFLDIYTWRNDIPEKYRKGWPLEAYYEYVKLHQLPDEERYQQLIYLEKQKYNGLINKGNKDLEERAKTLEENYKALVRTQKEQNRLDLEAIRKKQEELALQQKKLDDGLADLEKRKVAIDDLSNRLASEAMNIEASLIRFMEKENRLDQVCAIAAQMEPKSLARVFDEVTDDQLIYDIMGGLQPKHSANTLSHMDPEKAGKIMRISNNPLTLPPAGPARSYIPDSLTKLIDETQANKR